MPTGLLARANDCTVPSSQVPAPAPKHPGPPLMDSFKVPTVLSQYTFWPLSPTANDCTPVGVGSPSEASTLPP